MAAYGGLPMAAVSSPDAQGERLDGSAAGLSLPARRVRSAQAGRATGRYNAHR
jgi:hypothetical protein